jgi:hypothetical protein
MVLGEDAGTMHALHRTCADIKGLDMKVVECEVGCTGTHEFPVMLGYNHKDMHEPHFQSWEKNVSDEARAVVLVCPRPSLFGFLQQ